MTDEEYKNHITQLISDLSAGTYSCPEELARQMVEGHPANIGVLSAPALKAAGMTPIQVRNALRRVTLEREHSQRVIDRVGLMPANEREYVASFMKRSGYEMTYALKFSKNGRISSVDQVALDLQLTAGDLDLVHPRGKLLSTTNIQAALEEWITVTRTERKELVWQRISTLPPSRPAIDVFAEFRVVCDRYFSEWSFAMPAVLNYIWQVKRKMANLPIRDHYALVLWGPQNTGKTAFIRMLLGSVDEIAIETDAAQLVDDRAFEAKEAYAAFLDELAKADRTDITKLKNLITGSEYTARILYTHHSKKIVNNTTIIATSNVPLAGMVYDETGMRRFVEISPKSRAEMEPYWKAITEFDWLALWQAVDETGPDPLLPHAAILAAKQEEMRARGNVEAWLEQFEFNPYMGNIRAGSQSEGFVEWFGEDLYSIFRMFEEQYHPGSHGTSLQKWGRDFGALIATSKAKNWSRRMVGAKRAYRVELSNVVALNPPQKGYDDHDGSHDGPNWMAMIEATRIGIARSGDYIPSISLQFLGQ